MPDIQKDVKGFHPFTILVINGFLSSDRWSNLFGSISIKDGYATFTTHKSDQFVNNIVRYCRYYLVRYAISFLEPTLKSHNESTNKDCIFHFKENKKEITISLDAGHICDNCRNKLQSKLTSDINDAINKMLLVVSNQHPYSIILKGGGVKGLAFAGALLELENHFSFDAFAGTSAGSIAAVLLGAGYKPNELLKVLYEKDFGEFKDASIIEGIFNILTKKGFYPGDNIENWISELLIDKTKIQLKEIQLSDLINHTIIYASRIKDGTLVFDSQGERKETHAAFAARCSMSIPYYFSPKLIDGVRVYDGGLRNNFPLKKFIEDNKQKPFIGLYLKSDSKKGGFIFKELIYTAIDGEEIQTVYDNIDKVVVIDTQPIETTDFDLNNDKKDFLILAGRIGALEFIETNHPEINIDKDNLSQLKIQFDELRTKITND